MRNILFRGKDTETGEWIDGFYVCLNGKEHRIYSGFAETDCGNYYPDFWKVAPETVGQFTGVTDKDGNGIFEGDIVRFDNAVFVVQFYECRMGFAFSGLFGRGCVPGFVMTNWEHIEVIGNIHDNPELLETAKK